MRIRDWASTGTLALRHALSRRQNSEFQSIKRVEPYRRCKQALRACKYGTHKLAAGSRVGYNPRAQPAQAHFPTLPQFSRALQEFSVTGVKTLRKLFLAAVVCLLVPLLTMPAEARRVPPGSEDEIAERLRPYGQVCLEGEVCGEMVEPVATEAAPDAAPNAEVAEANGRSGQEIYDRFCFACHTTGAAGAPRLGQADEWQPRIDRGMETLMANTRNGIGAMPAMGTCMDCSDAELEASVDYILDSL